MKYKVVYEGEQWKIYYLYIDSFEMDLSALGLFLEKLEAQSEDLISITPNTGFVNVSIVLGTSFQGVKGFAVIVRKLVPSEPESKTMQEIKCDASQVKQCISCAKTFPFDYGACPYCHTRQ